MKDLMFDSFEGIYSIDRISLWMIKDMH